MSGVKTAGGGGEAGDQMDWEQVWGRTCRGQGTGAEARYPTNCPSGWGAFPNWCSLAAWGLEILMQGGGASKGLNQESSVEDGALRWAGSWKTYCKWEKLVQTLKNTSLISFFFFSFLFYSLLLAPFPSAWCWTFKSELSCQLDMHHWISHLTFLSLSVLIRKMRCLGYIIKILSPLSVSINTCLLSLLPCNLSR